MDFIAVRGRRTATTRDWGTLVSTEPVQRFFAFGQPILAPATGTVVSVHDGGADHVARRSQLTLVPYALTQAARVRGGAGAIAGNHVILELGIMAATSCSPTCAPVRSELARASRSRPAGSWPPAATRATPRSRTCMSRSWMLRTHSPRVASPFRSGIIGCGLDVVADGRGRPGHPQRVGGRRTAVARQIPSSPDRAGSRRIIRRSARRCNHSSNSHPIQDRAGGRPVQRVVSRHGDGPDDRKGGTRG